MRKVGLFMHMSLDGFAAGLNGELDWISYKAEATRQRRISKIITTLSKA